MLLPCQFRNRVTCINIFPFFHDHTPSVPNICITGCTILRRSRIRSQLPKTESQLLSPDVTFHYGTFPILLQVQKNWRTWRWYLPLFISLRVISPWKRLKNQDLVRIILTIPSGSGPRQQAEYRLMPANSRVRAIPLPTCLKISQQMVRIEKNNKAPDRAQMHSIRGLRPY